MSPAVPGLGPDGLAALRTSRTVAIVAGVVAVGAGVVLLAWPDATIKAVAFVIGLFLVAGGIAAAVDALVTRRAGTYWGLVLLRGLLDVAVGAMCIFWPQITVWVLVVLLGIELIIGGLLSVVVSRQVPKEMGTRHLWPGVISMAAGVAVIVWPTATVWVIVLLIGIYLILLGLLLLFTGYQLGKVDRLSPAG